MRVTEEKRFFAEHDYYEVLQIGADATSIDIENAFQSLSEDINLTHQNPQRRIQSAEKLLMITQAYEVLNHPVRRSQYDIRTFGRKNLPSNYKLDTLFREGMKAYRKRRTELALRCFKELTHLFPHRPLYRVHLAIAYAEKGWKAFCETELQTALKLDPEDSFAKETIAKLLFKMPDRKVVLFGSRLHRQVAGLAASFLFCVGMWASGVPQKTTSMAWAKVSDSAKEIMPKETRPDYRKSPALKDELPQEVQQELNKEQTLNTNSVELKKFDSNYVPEGSSYDYTKLVAKQKTYYPEQNIVVITYQDGSILTYKPQELKGWKMDEKTKQAVVITRENELIPSPVNIPVTLPDGTPADLGSPTFPSNLFPEYGAQTTLASTDNIAESKPATVSTNSENTQTPPIGTKTEVL